MGTVRRAGRAPAGGAAAAKGKKGSIEQEVSENVVDVLCSWLLLGGLTASVPYLNFMIPNVCSGSTDTFLTFNCVDSLVFSYLWLMVTAFCFTLPDASNNPWDVIYVSGHGIRKKAVRFGLQMGAAALFSVALKHANEKLANDLYANALPKVNLCKHPTASSYHAQLMKGQKCYEEWPAWTDDGFEFGAILNEAGHTFALNFILGVILPYTGELWRFVVPCVIITVLRSPFVITGPAMNMVPGTAAAVMHGGLDALRVFFIGSGLGKFCAMMLLSRMGQITAAVRGMLGGGQRSAEIDMSWAESKPKRGEKKKVA